MEKVLNKVMKEIARLEKKYGYDIYAMASFAYELGIEGKIDKKKAEGLERMYDFYISNDYYSSPLDELLIEKYYEEEDEADEE